jgi:DNA-binding transcriptional ArsR family regulator
MNTSIETGTATSDFTHYAEQAMTLPKLSANQSPEDFDKLLDQARKASELLKALSHEGRLLILCLLAEAERSVSELEEIMQMPQAAVSQQLARLRFDRLVNTRREGRVIYYSIASSEVATVIGTLYDVFCAPVRK